MATFTYFNGNLAFYRTEFWNYTVIEEASTENLIVLQFNTSNAPYDPYALAWRIELDTRGVQLHTVAEGPYAGMEQPISGTVEGARYYNQQGDLLMEATGLDGNLAMMALLFERGDGRQAWNVMVQGDHLYTGSDDSGVDWAGDEILTGAGNDTVNGNGGDDYIVDAGGSDAYFGGDGWDAISYSDHWFWNNPGGVQTGLRVNFEAGTVRGPDKQFDTISGIEAVRGTYLNDTMVGSSGDNQFMGMGGNDRIDGRDGFDEVRYDRDDRVFGFDGIRANLADGRVRDGFGNTDRISNIEAIRGTNQRDRITDDSANNRLRGEGGNDVLTVSAGNDRLRGGEGSDQFIFKGKAFGTDVIDDFSKADGDRIEILYANRYRDLTFTQDGADAVIKLNKNSHVVVLNFDIDDFSKGDFIF